MSMRLCSKENFKMNWDVNKIGITMLKYMKAGRTIKEGNGEVRCEGEDIVIKGKKYVGVVSRIQ